MHELIFHFEELKSDDSDGAVLFVEVVLKEDGGVPGRIFERPIGMRLIFIKRYRKSIFFVGGLLNLLVADAVPT